MRLEAVAMQYGIVFCDIDGTLLNSNHQVSADTIRKIRGLDEIGVPFVLVSARMRSGIMPVYRALGIRSPIVCYSGGLVLDDGQNPILSIGMEREKALAIKAYVDATWKGICCSAYSHDDWIVDDPHDPWIAQESVITQCEPEQAQLAARLVQGRPVHKFLCMGEPRMIADMGDVLTAKYPDLTVYRSKDTYLEIMDGGASKSNAVKVICEKYGIPVERSVSFGDNDNDIDMLEATGIGFAMGNAPERVKQKASHVTLDNDHEGVLAGLARLWG
jgi:Cof subfamily protein (haloacid dehalogenase superfamily)